MSQTPPALEAVDEPPARGGADVASPLRWTRTERLVAAAATGLLLVASATALTRAGDAVPDVPAAVAGPPSSVSDLAQDEARDDAGCVMLADGQPFPERTHLGPDDPTALDALYPRDRPAHSGRHFPRLLELPTVVPAQPIDERVVVHNMEHGSVVVWFDPSQTDAAAQGLMESWMQERRALGFASRAAGGIFVSPSDAIASGKAVAIRAWGVALDCDRFDLTVADAFLQRHWGSRGAAPEAHLSPFPPGVMREVGRSV